MEKFGILCFWLLVAAVLFGLGWFVSWYIPLGILAGGGAVAAIGLFIIADCFKSFGW